MSWSGFFRGLVNAGWSLADLDRLSIARALELLSEDGGDAGAGRRKVTKEEALDILRKRSQQPAKGG